MKLHIVSGGLAKNTKVMDEDGRELENILSIKWICDNPFKPSRVVLELHNTPVDVVGETDEGTSDG